VTVRASRLVVADPDAAVGATEEYWDLHRRDHRDSRAERRLTVPPQEVEWPAEAVAGWLSAAWLVIDALGLARRETPAAAIDFRGTETDDFVRQLPRFPRELETAADRGERVVLVAPERHRPRLAAYLAERRAGATALIATGELQRGFRLPPAGISIYSERQLFRDLGPPTPGRRSHLGPFVSGLRDLRLGDHVVHEEHGIGRYVALLHVETGTDGAAPLPASLESLRRDAVGAEVMELEYAGGRRLLLPLTRLDLIEKYSGVEGIAPRLDRLGGSSWNRTRSRVRAGMRKLAIDLLKLYADRQLQRAPAMPEDDDLQAQFEAAFEHEETRDQLEATAAIKADLQLERPMDRLLCGDVGFGKTEVAMRAAFKTVRGGHQVAVLAPTTILADQHFETFSKRFEGFPVTVDMVSRFRTAAEIREVAERAAAGRVDILIGTHRILSRDLDLPKLGLLVVDEEQRFGVAQKERFKELRRNVHVLAMSATPVPRTLQLSLAGVRDLSVIETPPRDRMAVETAIVPFSRQLVAEAIEFELARGGQVYYVYNHVEGIEAIQETLGEAVPQARITVGHGQLEERELASRMHGFKRGEYDVLLATTIIENGIDIPNVNTMLVHRADHFGLAQLYQLRGRVGRSDQLAYCYLLVPPDRTLPEVARRRLAAIREFTELGAGFRIAARDLEIRGAGNLLGAEQSGHMAAVGIETYLGMLEDTVRELRGEEVVERVSTAIDLPVPMAIPEDYVVDANLRMELYRKIVRGEAGRDEIVAELEDRFGAPPTQVHELLDVLSLKRQAEALRIQSISARKGGLRIRLRQDSTVDVESLVRMVSEREDLAFSPSGVLTVAGVAPGEMVAVCRSLLEALS
jgi:transcription-repair coupling factor (superfamily II helicase)